jgi:hypothetical protein
MEEALLLAMLVVEVVEQDQLVEHLVMLPLQEQEEMV